VRLFSCIIKTPKKVKKEVKEDEGGGEERGGGKKEEEGKRGTRQAFETQEFIAHNLA